MDVSELFCNRCGRIKRRCICEKESIREKNLKFLMEVSGKKELVPLFDTSDEIVFYRVFEPESAEPSVDLDEVAIPDPIKRILKLRGIEKLYPFQKRAMEELLDCKNVVITAPTGFGKTEAFAMPMFARVAENDGRAAVFYPTKALARDQEQKLKFYASKLGLNLVRFDGDSSYAERKAVFSGKADIILTNPDMVDFHLRNTSAFRDFVEELCYVAVDELHSYTGVLGTNMHYLFQRLYRFSDFQIACGSATIANAKEFAEELFEKEFVHVSGKHRKARTHLIMRYSNLYSAVRDIVKALYGRKILIFGNSWKSVETMGWILNREGIRAAVHKSGLPKSVRDEVERKFKRGEIKVVVSTPTLELGIDIGDVDVVISELVNYSQFIQRSGRAGRMGQESVAVLLLREEDAISNYYRMKPEDYFKDEFQAYVEKNNEELMIFHIASMCMEMPLSRNEIRENWKRVVEGLERRKLIFDANGFILASPSIADFISSFSMRGVGDTVKMVMDGEIIGERTLPIALKELFPGGVVIHNGRGIRSLSLDLRKREAVVEKDDGRTITDPLYTSIPRIIEVIESVQEPLDTYYCSMEITMSIYGYIERDVFTGERKGVQYLDEPISYTFPTKGIIFSAPFPPAMDYEDFFAGSFHALEHVLIEASDAVTGGASQQMGGISTPEGDIFIYDAVKGGAGLSKLLFRRFSRAFEIAYEVLKSCECRRIDGCPRCTYSYQCGNNNQPLNRIGAMEVARLVLKGRKRAVELEKYEEVTEFQYFP